jgi:hypothetical protein
MPKQARMCRSDLGGMIFFAAFYEYAYCLALTQ